MMRAKKIAKNLRMLQWRGLPASYPVADRDRTTHCEIDSVVAHQRAVLVAWHPDSAS